MNNSPLLSDALDQIENYLTENKIVLASVGESFTGSIVRDPFSRDGIPYGEVKQAHYPIETLKGKATKKYLHVTITRLDRGYYEPVAYVL